MGLFGGGNSKSSNTTSNDNRTDLDNSIREVDGNDSSLNLSSVYDSNINLTMTDGGAIANSLDFAGSVGANAIDSVRMGSTEALKQSTQISRDAISAVRDSYQGDTQAVLPDAIKWGALALAAVFIVPRVLKR